MKGSLQNKLKFNSIALLIIIILSLGIFFRVSGINSKVYWHDEVATSIKVAGYTFQEIDTLPFEQGTILVSDLDKYQYPNNQKNYLDSINALSIEEPQLTPLYFLLLRLWIRIFGQSIVTIRSFSVIISLLIIPVFYWLCFELFDSVTIGWMGILLVSVSPIHIIYAHEARPYIMWGLTTMLSCIAFLKAIKYSNKLGGRSTGTLRYFVPSWLGIEIILAYLLVKKSFNLSLPSWQLFLSETRHNCPQ